MLEIVGVQSSPPYSAGLPQSIHVVGRASSAFTKVRVVARLAPGGAPLLDQETPVVFQNDPGYWSVALDPALAPVPLACGGQLHITATAVEGPGVGAPGDSVAALTAIACKPPPASPGGPGGAPGGGAAGGSGGGSEGGSDWPDWLPPPSIACPQFGRAFTLLLFAGLTLLVLAVATGSAAAWGAAVAALAAAGATYVVWVTMLCFPNDCVLWGAVLWALKRAVLAGALIAAFNLSVAAAGLVAALGVAAGVLVVYLRERFCMMPSARTPLSNLPLW